MPRIAETSKSLAADLTTRLERLIEAARAEGRDAALAEVRSLIGGSTATGAAPVVAKKRGRPIGSKNKPKSDASPAKATKTRKSSWAGLTPEARLARVNAIRRGRGLPLKTSL